MNSGKLSSETILSQARCMKQFYEKPCRRCKALFIPAGPAGLYCSPCGGIQKQEASRRAVRARPSYKGTGRGAPRGEKHPLFRHGRWTYQTVAREIKTTRGECERCKKDLLEATHYLWCVHHRDHDPYNYHVENLELLCKRCHQVEHECYKRLEGATTIPKGSRPKRAEAPDTPMG